MHLLGLLSEVGLVTNSSDDTLECTPSISDTGWDPLIGKETIEESLHVGNSGSHELGLGVADADENGVDNQENPAVRENQGSEEDASPESEFEAGDQVHASVIVLLDEAANSLGQWWLWALAERSVGWDSSSGGGSSWWWWHKSWEEVGAEVGEEVESRVDGVWEESVEDGLGEEPDKGEDEVLDILVSEKSLWLQAGSSGGTSLVRLKYNDSVGNGCGDESQSVGESSPGRRSVELNGGKGVAKSAEEEQEMSNEPAKLQGLGDSQNSLL